MFFVDRMQRYRVVGCIGELLLEYLGPKDGKEALRGLLGITNLLEELGRLDLTALVKQLRKGGFAVNDVAVSVYRWNGDISDGLSQRVGTDGSRRIVDSSIRACSG